MALVWCLTTRRSCGATRPLDVERQVPMSDHSLHGPVFPARDARPHYRLGAWISGVTAVLTVITFAIAIMTPPLSGPFCLKDCYTYPYLDTAARFPRDFYWMYPSMGLMLLFVAFTAVIHETTSLPGRIWSQLALCFGLLSSGIIVADYFLQVSVIQPSLLRGEADGLALLSQFNPHGIFIALEEIGYLLLVLSLSCLAPIAWNAGRLGRTAAVTAIVALVASLLSLVGVSLVYGVMREYRFEVAVISFAWLALIVIAGLFALIFRRAESASPPKVAAPRAHPIER